MPDLLRHRGRLRSHHRRQAPPQQRQGRASYHARCIQGCAFDLLPVERPATSRISGAGHAADHVSRPHTLTRGRSEEHTSELQSLMRISYAVFCLKKKKLLITKQHKKTTHDHTSVSRTIEIKHEYA